MVFDCNTTGSNAWKSFIGNVLEGRITINPEDATTGNFTGEFIDEVDPTKRTPLEGRCFAGAMYFVMPRTNPVVMYCGEKLPVGTITFVVGHRYKLTAPAPDNLSASALRNLQAALAADDWVAEKGT